MATEKEAKQNLSTNVIFENEVFENNDHSMGHTNRAFEHNGIFQRTDSLWTFNQSRRLKRRNQIQRVMEKDGACNVVHSHIKHRNYRFFTDAFTTVIDLKWRYNLCLFTMVYVITWFLFGTIWFLIAYLHGDVGRADDEENDFEPCVYNVGTFTGAFLFSIETQTTIGYGYRSVSEECPHAAILVVVQSVASYLINSIMLGLIFVKIARPKKRVATLKFSRNAVIAMRDGMLCLMFRVGDIRGSGCLFEAHLRAYAIKSKITPEGEYIPLYHHDMDLNYERGEDRIFLMWPLIICHPIDRNSPLYNLSAADLQMQNTRSLRLSSGHFSEAHSFSTQQVHEGDFEIVVILEGVIEQTGLVTQARTSYLPSEIKWGHRFHSTAISLTSQNDKQYRVDYNQFNALYEIKGFPKESAKKIYEAKKNKDKTHQKCNSKEQKQSSHNKQENDIVERSVEQILHTLQELTDKVESLEAAMNKNTVCAPPESPPESPPNSPLWDPASRKLNKENSLVFSSTEGVAPNQRDSCRVS